MTYPDSILGVPMGPWEHYGMVGAVCRRGHSPGVRIRHVRMATIETLAVDWDDGCGICVAGAPFDEALSALRRELVRIGHRRCRPRTEDV